MTDPAPIPVPPSDGQQLNRVFMFAAATDLLTGLVLVAIGLSVDEIVLVVIGLVLALSGTAVTSWLIIRSNRPTEL
jgi:hypothetical protein